ncbi:MAG: signal peptidase II [Candidatus Thiodiazotropha sp. (ex Dulcina madagascariensis)]|nr:signal peptidase II [Candidatus Thiodiazotropha sp. (ex Dulcina madagascariensis)]
MILAIAATLVLIAWLWRLTREEQWTAVALSLIIGGAIGNVKC